MLRLFVQFIARNFRSHRLRSALTLLGIAIGTSLPMSVAVATRSISGSFVDIVDGIMGRAVLQVAGDENGFNEDVLPLVQGTEGVRVAVPLILGSGFVRGLRGESIHVFGVDMIEDSKIRSYRDREGIIDDPIAFLNQPDSIVLTTDLASRIGVGLEEPIELLTVQGLRTLTVRGLIEPRGPLAKAFAGNLAVMDVFAAQQVFGRDFRFDQIDVDLLPGFDADAVAADLEARLPPELDVERPEYRSGQVDNLLSSFEMMLSAFAALSVLIGGFLVYNTMSISVSQRRREISILRAVGASRRQVLGVFVVEAFSLGVVGAGLGVAAGAAMAGMIVDSVAHMMSTGLFLNFDVREVIVPRSGAAISFLSGVLAATFSGFLPARRASAASPLEAASAVEPTGYRVSRYALAFGCGILLSVPLWVLMTIRNEGGVFVILSDVALYLGFTILVPFVVLGAVRLLRPARARLFGVPGLLAMDGVERWPDRTAVTVAVLSITLSFSVMVGSLAGSFKNSLIEWLHQAVPVDMTVSSNRLTAGWLRTAIGSELGEELKTVPGVDKVLALRVVQADLEERRITIKAMDIEPGCSRCGQHSGYLPFEAGDWEEATRELAAGGSVLVSNNFADHFDTELEDELTLRTPFGLEKFRVAGIVVEYTSDQGVIIMNRRDFARGWRDELVNYFNIFLTPGARVDEVRTEIAHTYGEPYQIRILDSQAQNKEVTDRIDQAFQFIAIIEFLAFSLAVVGIANTLLVSTLERVREIGVLRAVGLRRRPLARSVLIEAVFIGVTGAAAGILLGSISSVIWVNVSFKHVMGWVIEYSFPAGTATVAVVVAVLISAVASVVPALIAARTNVVNALAAE